MAHYICVRFMVAVSNVILVNVVNTVKSLFLFKLASLRNVQQSVYVKQSRLRVVQLRGG
jgi:hypothetical protein